MYPLPDELVLSPTTSAALDMGFDNTSSVEEYVCVLRLPLESIGDEDQGRGHDKMDKADEVEIKIIIPNPSFEPSMSNASTFDARNDLASSRPTLKLHRLPPELVRADVDTLERQFQDLQSGGVTNHSHPDPIHTQFEEPSDPVEWITTTISSFLPTISHTLSSRRLTLSTLQPPSSNPPTTSLNPNSPLERCYLWFPSLSTPAKRKDLVTYASRYDLTGFVLAGKPGLLCLEGTSEGFGKYLNDIKNESWSDIPSYQKKVSGEFYRLGERQTVVSSCSFECRLCRSPNEPDTRSLIERSRI